MNRPMGVTILGWVAIVLGAVNILMSLPYFGISALASLFGPVGTIAAAVGVWFGLGNLIVGIIEVVTGIGALNLRSWAWTVGVIIFGINLIMALIAMVTVDFTSSALISAGIAAVVLAYLFTREVRAAFDHADGSLFHTGHHGGMTPA